MSSTMTILRQVVQSKEFKWAIGGWTFFIAENAILSENRTYLIEALGDSDENYRLAYGTLSTVAMTSIGYAYYHLTRHNPILVQYFNSSVSSLKPPPLPIANLLVSWTCLSIGLVLASQALPKMQIPVRLSSSSSSQHQASSTSSNDNVLDVIGPLPPPSPQQQPAGVVGWKLSVQCPFDFSDKYKDNNNSNINNNNVVTGVDRVSRHVGLWSLGLISAAQAALIIPSTAAAAVSSVAAGAASAAPLLFTSLWSLRLWWCGPMAVAWLGGMHSDSRFRRGMGGTLDPMIDCQTSNIPFIAMLTGKQGSSPYDAFWNLWLEIKPLNAIMATAVATIYIMSKGRTLVMPLLSSSSKNRFAAMHQNTKTTTTATSMVHTK